MHCSPKIFCFYLDIVILQYMIYVSNSTKGWINCAPLILSYRACVVSHGLKCFLFDHVVKLFNRLWTDRLYRSSSIN